MQKSCRASSPERRDLPILQPESHPPLCSPSASEIPCDACQAEAPDCQGFRIQGLAGGCKSGLRRVNIFKPALLEAHLEVAASCCGLCTEGHPSSLEAARTKDVLLLGTISCSRNILEEIWPWLCQGVIQSPATLQSPGQQGQSLLPICRATASTVEVRVTIPFARDQYLAPLAWADPSV